MAADYYEVDLRTIENCLSANENELHKNGYRVLTGKELKEFKLRFDAEIDFGIAVVNDEDYSESIKLELIEAMSKDIGFSDYRADSKKLT